MTELIKKIIDNIKDGQESQIKLTIEDGKQMHLNCKFKKAESPHFSLVFPSNSLPHSIDIERTHPVTIPYLKSSMSLSAKIVTILDDTTLELIAKETVDPASLREYFRVDVSTAIEASYEVKKGNPKNNWTMAGT
ncbi:MAG: hypothetical protein GY705_22020, partial [Bacteroidetes bacterium]|nr:hypothetical protein [Bacteroidota bacterium]